MTSRQSSIRKSEKEKILALANCSSRIQEIQAEMTLRALELLNLDQDTPAYLLDIGCGSGLSGEIIQEEGHYWVGMDIAPAMLQIAIDREVEGDLFWQDAGEGMGFRPGTFDGAIRYVESKRCHG